MIACAQIMAPVAASQQRNAGLRPAISAIQPRMIGSRAPGRPGARLQPVAAGKDFDEVLMDVANRFEKADNKVPIIGWTLAAFFAITTAEWFMNLPLFNVLLGFPVQFLGLLTAANFGLKIYRGQKVDFMNELEGLVNDVSKELPGIGK